MHIAEVARARRAMLMREAEEHRLARELQPEPDVQVGHDQLGRRALKALTALLPHRVRPAAS